MNGTNYEVPHCGATERESTYKNIKLERKFIRLVYVDAFKMWMKNSIKYRKVNKACKINEIKLVMSRRENARV